VTISCFDRRCAKDIPAVLPDQVVDGCRRTSDEQEIDRDVRKRGPGRRPAWLERDHPILVEIDGLAEEAHPDFRGLDNTSKPRRPSACGDIVDGLERR
jgi:hypothetical protein